MWYPTKRKNRDAVEIAGDILRVSRMGARKTRLMYKANLSFSQLRKYLHLLTYAGLIIFDAETRLYRASVKGRLFLGVFDHFERTYQSMNENRSVLISLLKKDGEKLIPASYHQAKQEGNQVNRWLGY